MADNAIDKLCEADNIDKIGNIAKNIFVSNLPLILNDLKKLAAKDDEGQATIKTNIKVEFTAYNNCELVDITPRVEWELKEKKVDAGDTITIDTQTPDLLPDDLFNQN